MYNLRGDQLGKFVEFCPREGEDGNELVRPFRISLVSFWSRGFFICSELGNI
jgi:hypothetical protein